MALPDDGEIVNGVAAALDYAHARCTRHRSRDHVAGPLGLSGSLRGWVSGRDRVKQRLLGHSAWLTIKTDIDAGVDI